MLLTLYREDRVVAKSDSCSGCGAVLISSPHGPHGSNKARTELWPANPETFFAAQKRNRRATWRMSALCTFAAFIMGIPLTLVLTPLLYTLGMVVLETVNHFSPQPELLQQANDLAKLGLRVADYVINQKGTLDPGELAAGLTLVLLPGMVVAYGLWFAMLALFRHGGVGGTLASMNAREPNQADLKELQLADVAQEMAIAAGLPAPKIMLVDSIGANAAAVGTSLHDARIVISRRLLDDLDRDQMQAILAHLVGSIGNGDLGIAFTVTSVFETCGLLLDIINAPFGKESRSQLVARGAIHARRRHAGKTSGRRRGDRRITCYLNRWRHAGHGPIFQEGQSRSDQESLSLGDVPAHVHQHGDRAYTLDFSERIAGTIAWPCCGARAATWPTQAQWSLRAILTRWPARCNA